jgi:uncharacterized protein (TIGR00369 family)
VSEVTAARQAMFAHPGPGASTADWVAWANALPAIEALRMTCLELDETGGRFALPVDPPFPLNANGVVNGGYLASAVDQALGALGGRVSPEGNLAVTAALNLQFHLPAFPPLTVEATVLPGGRRVMFFEVTIQDARGRRCVTAAATMVAVGPTHGTSG